MKLLILSFFTILMAYSLCFNSSKGGEEPLPETRATLSEGDSLSLHATERAETLGVFIP